MARTLKDFLGAHRGETAWVFGKGPSLDRFSMAEAGPLRCAINDTVMAVPGCRYCFANDSVRNWKHVYQPGHVLFTPARTIQDAFLDPAAAPEVVSYPDERDEMRLAWPPERLAREGLAILPGTLNSAVQILFIMGVRKLVCVGIDGGGSVAQCQRWHTRLRLEYARDYNRIREVFIWAAGILRLELEFPGSPPASPTFPAPQGMTPLNGMNLIEITRNTFIEGRPVEVGSIINATPENARLLIRLRKAVRYAPPVTPALAPAPVETIETAEAAPPPTETADAVPTRSRRRRPIK